MDLRRISLELVFIPPMDGYDDGIGLLTLNRPEKRNALDPKTWEEIYLADVNQANVQVSFTTDPAALRSRIRPVYSD